MLTERQIITSLVPTLDQERLLDAYALSKIAEAARYATDYVADSAWSEAVVLTSVGEAVLAAAKAISTDVAPADWCMAMFGFFYYHDLFIDISKTDVSAVEQLIATDLAKGRARLPYLFGREIYDRFNEAYPREVLRELNGEQVQTLLEGTFQGVHQLGTLLVGPLGFMHVPHRRYLPPTNDPMVLWHGRRRGKVRAYPVGFNPPEIPIVECYQAIGDALIVSSGKSGGSDSGKSGGF